MASLGALGKPRVFLSYSRRDTDFIDELVISLESHGFEVVFDRADLFPGEPWEPRLQRLITDAETTVCVVSKNWLGSDQCGKELGIAVRNGRRIVPVIIDPVNPSDMPEDLARLQFVFFHGTGHSYARGVASLVETLRTDIGWVREQTRLLDKASEWAAQNKAPALLLRGVALETALAWIGAPPPRDTRVLPQVTEFIDASRAAQESEEKTRLRDRLRFTVVALAACVFALVGTGAVGFIIFDRLQVAEIAKDDAVRGEQRAVATLDETTQVLENQLMEVKAEPPVVTRQPDQVVPSPSPAVPDDQISGREDSPPPAPAGPLDDGRVDRLVAELNSPDKATRLAAGQAVTGIVRSPGNDAMLRALSDQLEPTKFASLSAAGRVNILYMLNANRAWASSPLAPGLNERLEAILAPNKIGLILGGQASQCIEILRAQLAGKPGSGCGA